MDLPVLWFVIIGVLWTGYFVLEGFDFGVGLLLPVLGGRGRSKESADGASADTRRRVLLNTIGPVWDGNEVWFITAGGAMFAAFPHWYATMFSGFYLPLLAIIVALILRNLGLDYRHKRPGARWKAGWDRAIIGGSLAAPFLWGVALTNLVHGVPLDADRELAGSVTDLLGPVPLLGGVTFVALFLTHGAIFVALKTEGPIRAEARQVAARAGVVTAVLAVVLLLLLGARHADPWSWATTVLAALCLVAALAANTRGREGRAFLGTALTTALVVATYFLLLFPNVIAATDPAFDLTIAAAASSHYTLSVMSVVAVVFTPLVLLYQGYTYWVFRRRIGTRHIPTDRPTARPVPSGSR